MSEGFFGKALAALKDKLTPAAPKSASSRSWDPMALQREMEKFAKLAVQEGLADLEGRMNTAGISNKPTETADSWYHIARPELETDVSSRLGKRYNLLVPGATTQAAEAGISLSSVEAYCLVSKDGQGVIQILVSLQADNAGKRVKRRLTERRRFSQDKAPGPDGKPTPIRVEPTSFFRSLDEA